MSRFIAIANQKGGVGKTTTTVNLAASLANFGQRVLVLDMDPQGNASSGLGVAANTLHRGVYEVLMGSMSIEEAITQQASPGVDLLPSGQRLIGAEVELVSALARERILEKAIQPIRDQYDILLADCPPSLGLLTVNTLTAADTVLIPMQCEFYALEGLTQLLNTIKLIQQALNPRLEIEGILLTMFDARLNLSREVAEEARKFFPGRVYETVIPRNVRLSEAPSFGKPVLQYDPECSGAQFYLKLAREVLELPEDAVPQAVTSQEAEPEAVSEVGDVRAEYPVASPDEYVSVEADVVSTTDDNAPVEVTAASASTDDNAPVEADAAASTDENVPVEVNATSSTDEYASVEADAASASTDVHVPIEADPVSWPGETAVDPSWSAETPSDEAGVTSWTTDEPADEPTSEPVSVAEISAPYEPDELVAEPQVVAPAPEAYLSSEVAVLSPDDLTDDVVTLSEESIVLTPEPTSANAEADPAAHIDLQPMNEQDAHPQEELVSHD